MNDLVAPTTSTALFSDIVARARCDFVAQPQAVQFATTSSEHGGAGPYGRVDADSSDDEMPGAHAISPLTLNCACGATPSRLLLCVGLTNSVMVCGDSNGS